MTEKDLDEFEKEFGFKLLPTGFKKPLSKITKEEYRERIEYLYNAIINDDSNDEDDFKMIEERIDALIRAYQRNIDDNCKFIENTGNNVIDLRNENSYFEQFIESLKYAKTGEIE